ncbi:mitochondrial translocase of outer membrane Tom40 subunit [Andalucia godoyi]|uniref:Mitochondrial translocase of outer membrane Tom40 subunit n=1 Tax=Andalucia godoyi TaxID=505711 RepID=A0A8K0AK57_ANDGO|nr:mitochondrial translocase of outer membrane Tom40 subunit [Andalucia godoyi]|eukprot:ANDGO_03085.mRNA.1 mitochondrial translocase of outer membrane Tom40 subunit
MQMASSTGFSGPVPFKYEQHAREFQQLFPAASEVLEGFRMQLQKSVSQSATHDFSTAHGIIMTANPRVPSEYSFGATYHTATSMLMARMDTNGMILAQTKLPLDEGLSLEGVFQAAGPNDFTAAELEWKGADFVATLKTNSQLVFGTTYMQHLGKGVFAGVEGEYNAEERRSKLAYAARWEQKKDTVWSVEVQPQGAQGFAVQAGWFHRIGDRLTAGAQINCIPGKRVADGKIGYEYSFFHGRFRGCIDTDGKVQGVLEEKLNGAANFVLSADMNHSKNEYRFGIGLNMGGM